MNFEPSQMHDGDYYANTLVEEVAEDRFILNMGPQHPSTHGVLRIVLEMEGEYIVQADPVLGYIHRMHEKMGENRTYSQYLPNMGRVDYLHALAWNWAYVGAVEKLASVEVTPRAEYIRMITCEFNRISSHLLWWGAYLLDLGAFTPIMYAFADREKILDMLQIVTGSRLTYCYYMFGGVPHDLTPEFIESAKAFVPYMRSRLPMYEGLVTGNYILRKRCEEIGVLDLDMAKGYGASGPVLRGSGIANDTRVTEPYSLYHELDFEIPTHGDCDAMSRYMVRIREIEESLNIIEQALEKLPEGPCMHEDAPFMVRPPAGEAYFAVESARGKVGVCVQSDGGPQPYRVKLRSPSFSNLSLFGELSQGTLLADAVSILGSLDLVIPEIDR